MHGLRPIVPVLVLAAIATPAFAQQTEVTTAKKLPSHPAEVALVDEGERGSVYRQFPTGQRLYTFDRDPHGRSVCNVGCAMAWPPVPAPADAVTTGEWTIVRRADGSLQWAFRGKPVYTRFHDAPDAPTGEISNNAWHLVPYMPIPATPALATAKH